MTETNNAHCALANYRHLFIPNYLCAIKLEKYAQEKGRGENEAVGRIIRERKMNREGLWEV